MLGGKRHGQGRMSFRDSPVVYEGEWWQGVRHGQGQITLNVEGSHWYRGEGECAWGKRRGEDGAVKGFRV